MQLSGLVRDKDGIPKFDDPQNAPADVKALLTDADLLKMNHTVVEQLGFRPRLIALLNTGIDG